MTETFGPEYVKPAPRDCPDCPCCSAALCEKGRTNVQACVALASRAEARPVVTGCPCSDETTRGTAAWRAARYRVTLQATVQPVAVDVEAALRAVAAGDVTQDMAEQVTALTARRYVVFRESRPELTHLGARYLEARDEARYRTPVEVESVDVVARTARVIVVGWNLTQGVTVLLDQLVVETKLPPADLVGKFLEADANCRTEDGDDLVLTRVTVAPPLPAGWMDGDTGPAPTAGAAEPETGRVDGAPSGGEA